MMLSGDEIEKRIGTGEIKITPFYKKQLNPNSYDLRLSNELKMAKKIPLDMKREPEMKTIIIPESGFLLKPGFLYLGRTFERTVTKNFVPMIQGRSSVGRLGISVHISAGFGNVGFDGYWTLEIGCIHPVKIYPMVKICQIYYHTIMGDISIYDEGRYQNNDGIQHSLMYRDFEENND